MYSIPIQHSAEIHLKCYKKIGIFSRSLKYNRGVDKGLEFVFISSEPKEIVDIFNLLYQEKLGGNESKMLFKETNEKNEEHLDYA